MRAILVVEMPQGCMVCPICHESEMSGEYMCDGRNIEEYLMGFYGSKPDWCPLKPIPQKMEYEGEIDYEYGYIDGRNECIDEIMGETE